MNTVQEEEVKYIPEGAKWFCITRSQGARERGEKKINTIDRFPRYSSFGEVFP